MGELSADKIAMLKGLVAASPDEVVRGLEQAVCRGGLNGPMAAISALVEAEVTQRVVRHHTLEPLIGLFRAPHDDGRPAFSRGALNALWRALNAAHPKWIAAAVEACQYIDPSEPSPEIFDRLCKAAADALESEDAAGFEIVRDLLEGGEEGATRRLVEALRIAAILREPLRGLDRWLQQMTDERRAAARIAYADACAIGDGGGPMMFEMLASRTEVPARILRIASSIMDRPTDRFFAESELGFLGERAVSEAEACLVRLRALRPGTGPAESEEAARCVQVAHEAITELEQAVEFSKGGPWTDRIVRVKRGIAGTVEDRLGEIEGAVKLALPTEKIRYSGRLVSIVPKMDEPPNDSAVTLATGLLGFSEALRSLAVQAGFGGARAKVHEVVGHRIDQYVEDVIGQIRLGDIENDDRARDYLDVAARLLTLVRDKQAGSIIRRRAAAA